MLFEAGSVKAGGGENWIPLCLPGFNNTGFLYMYVSFLDIGDDLAKVSEERPQASSTRDDGQLAIILISADKEAFYELRQMRDDLIEVSRLVLPTSTTTESTNKLHLATQSKRQHDRPQNRHPHRPPFHPFHPPFLPPSSTSSTNPAPTSNSSVPLSTRTLFI